MWLLVLLSSAQATSALVPDPSQYSTSLGQHEVRVHNAGDVDRDGDDELLVTIPGFDNLDGWACLLDAPLLGTTCRTTFRGANEEHLGFDAAAGDFDGDGERDIVIVALFADTAQNDRGAAYLFRGPIPTGDLTVADADVVLGGFQLPFKLWYVDALPDLDGDGDDELAVAGDAVGTVWSSVAIVRGGTLAPVVEPRSGAHAAVIGRTDENFGDTLAHGDLDGDGLLDLVVSSTGAAGQGGVTWVVSDVASLPPGQSRASLVGASVTGASRNHELSGETLAVGDYDGDGVDDLAIGAPGFGFEGRMYVMPGQAGRWAAGQAHDAGATGFTVLGNNPAQYLSIGLMSVSALRGAWLAAGQYGYALPEMYLYRWTSGFPRDGVTLDAATAPFGLDGPSRWTNIQPGVQADTDGDGRPEIWLPWQENSWYLVHWP